MSVQQTRSRLVLRSSGRAEDVSTSDFEVFGFFDISDLRAPKHVGAVQTARFTYPFCRFWLGEDGNIIVYNSGTSSIREREEMDSCFDESWRPTNRTVSH